MLFLQKFFPITLAIMSIYIKTKPALNRSSLHYKIKIPSLYLHSPGFCI